MFREMRRKEQLLTPEESIKILTEGTSGTLALLGDEGYPYAVPLSYVYRDGRILFHCAASGHKLDAVAHCGKASFCVIQQDQVRPREYTTYYRSVILFGQIRLLSREAQKREALSALAAKYAPEEGQARLEKALGQMGQTRVLELTIEHMTGKEAVELAKQRERRDP